MTLVQNLVNAKRYIIETGDQPEEYGAEYGTDYWDIDPNYFNRFEKVHVPYSSQLSHIRGHLTCSWGQYNASSNVQGPCGVEDQQRRGLGNVLALMAPQEHLLCVEGDTPARLKLSRIPPARNNINKQQKGTMRPNHIVIRRDNKRRDQSL